MSSACRWYLNFHRDILEIIFKLGNYSYFGRCLKKKNENVLNFRGNLIEIDTESLTKISKTNSIFQSYTMIDLRFSSALTMKDE